MLDSFRQALARALLPGGTRRALDVVTRELLPDGGLPRSDSAVPRVVARLDIDEGAQLQLLRTFEADAFQDLFAKLRADPSINQDDAKGALAGRGPIRNPFYPTPDAEIYAALIVHARPRRIIEIGSGFSTRVARAAVDAASPTTEIHVVDPAPRRAVEGIADRIEHSPVEHSSLATEGVPPDTLLFIDSSHVTRSGGDGPFLYGTLLPQLPPGVLIQIHDVFLPYDYPKIYVERLYTEQYLLQALLANSAKFETVLSTYLLSRRHGEAMRRVFGERVARDGRLEGASFWMRSVG